MGRFRSPIVIGVAALALVIALGGAGVLLARETFADGPWRGGPWHGGYGLELPPELESLRDLPSDERFAHFMGGQITLTDVDGNPLTVTFVPGRATAVSATSLTIAANDGSAQTFTLDDATVIAGKRRDEDGARSIEQDDRVVVVTRDGGTTATAVLSGDWHGFGRRGFHGRFGPGR
jgi:hypothetical protein